MAGHMFGCSMLYEGSVQPQCKHDVHGQPAATMSYLTVRVSTAAHSGCRVEEEEALHERNVLAALYCPALDALITSAEEGAIRIHWLNMRWG